MKVLTVVGNRPQFIKAAPLSLALAEAGVDEVGLHSGQHWDDELSGVFYDELGIPEPRHALELRSADPARMEPAIQAIVREERPDWVLVFGDTNTTLAGAAAAVAEGVPLAHVEAGLRSGDLSMPEERNRIAVDRISSLLLAPADSAADVLREERIAGRVGVVGDVMADAVRLFTPVARERYAPPHPPGTYAVATVHREANVRPERLARIVDGLNRLEEPIVFPLHPRTRSVLEAEVLRVAPHVDLRAPLGYLEMTSALSSARLLVTDSGGLQKEAYWAGIPCVTLRPSTEWHETVAAGANTLVDVDPDALVEAVARAAMPENPPTLYGDGFAAQRIVQALLATIPGR